MEAARIGPPPQETPPKMKNLLRLVLVPFLLGALSGCGGYELAKGDVVRIEKRTLAAGESGFRLRPVGPGRAVLERVGLCPAQERRVYQEVEVRRASGAVTGAQGVGCTIEKIGEVSQIIAGQRPRRAGNCMNVGATDRHPTGRTVTGDWETVRREPCGAREPVPAGGSVRVTFLRSGKGRELALGDGGLLRLPEEELIKLRLYLTVLKGVKVEVRYAGKTWRQAIDFE